MFLSLVEVATSAGVVVMKKTTFAIQVELVVKSFQADAQQLSRAGFVVLRLLQGAHNHLALDFFEWRAHRQRQRVFVAQAFALFDWIRSEMMALDLFAGTDDHGAFDHVAELAYVAGPGMKLQRLESRGWISGAWGTSDNGRRARFYSLTAAGRKQFAVERGRWNRLVESIERVMEPNPTPEKA